MTICKTAIIHDKAKIGKNVIIKSFAVIGDCIIKDNCIIHQHAFINDHCLLEEGVEVFNGAVIGKEPKARSTARPVHFNQQLVVGRETIIGPHAIIYYDVSIGERTLIGDGASIREQCTIGNQCIISRYVTLNYNTQVGNHSKIMDNSHITGNMVIGDNVFISAMVGSANDNQVNKGYGPHVRGPVLKDNAIIGLGANLLPNVTVHENAFVGSAALVTKDVLANTRVKGIPAK